MNRLNECFSCRNIIRLQDAVCPLCKAFQLHIDYTTEDKKIEAYVKFDERRYYCNIKLQEMRERKCSQEEIENKIDDFLAKEKELKTELQRKIERKQFFLLN